MKLSQRLSRFGRANQGLAALEFAILAPMMVLLLFGSVELIDVLGANRRVENAAASLADVVARDTEVTDEEIDGLWGALSVLLYPENEAEMDVRITSITIEDSNTATVVWSEGHGMAARLPNSNITLPAAMMRPGTSIIMAEAQFSYDSPMGFIISDPMTLSHTVYRRSRLVDPIPRVD